MKFLAVAEAGKIGAAAERLAIAQPALTRTIARLEARFGARLFERLPTGVRLTPLGETAVELARGLLREIDAAAEKFDAVIRGRTGSYRITASSMWMEAVLAPAVDAFSARLPGIELTLRTAPFGDGLQLLANGDSDLHCGGMDTDEPLPAFLRREYFLDITVGVVACEDHPLLAGHANRRRPRRLSLDRLRRAAPRGDCHAGGPGQALVPRPPSGRPVPRDRPARIDRAAGESGGPVPDGDWVLARLAAAELPRTAHRAAAQAPSDPVRPSALPDRLRRPAFCGGS